MRLLTAAFVVVATLAAPCRASAQPTTKWDSGASFGLFWGDGFDADGQGNDEGPWVAYQFDLGRYWGTHLKTDVGVILTPERNDYDFEPFPAGGVGAYSFTNHDRSLTAFSGAATYQFFDNELVHPYVSGGAQVARVGHHRYRDTQAYPGTRGGVVVPALDERFDRVVVRPFVAVGCKSYFNERTFVRSELLTAVDGHGFSHATIRLGLGVDF